MQDETNLVEACRMELVPLTRPDGVVLHAVDLSFDITTHSQAGQERRVWPTIRLTQDSWQKLLAALSDAYAQSKSKAPDAPH